jgi:hypothetical protein
MTALERALLDLDVEWPDTPDVAGAVRARVEMTTPEAAAAGAPRQRLRGWRRRLAVATAALAVLGGGAMAASPAARSAVLRWLGLEGVEIRRARPSATPPKRSRLGETLQLGAPIPVARALSAGALAPRALGTPGAAYRGPDGALALVYAPRAGLPASRITGVALLVQTFHARVSPLIEKLVYVGDAQRLTVAGAPAYWIGGAAHGFEYLTPTGAGFAPQRLADHTLLVESHGLLLRVEGPLTRARAAWIARNALVH